MTVLEALSEMFSLSARQAECLALILLSIDERGYPPTYRELMPLLGYKYPNGVLYHLRALAVKGAIELAPDHEARAIRPRVRWMPAAQLVTPTA